jgi:hypothetical protein
MTARMEAFPKPIIAAANDGYEACSKAGNAGVVPVARRLIDRSFPPELGLEGYDRDTVGLLAAVATTFANTLVDQRAGSG